MIAMGKTQISRNERRCVLCSYWNGAIGSTTIQILNGGNVFTFENTEKQYCFKKGRGFQTMAVQECPFFRRRYDD